VDQNFKIPKLIVGDFNYRNINWYSVPGCGASARCSGLSENEMAFVKSLRENLLLQRVVYPTRQHGTDTPHILDLVLTSFDFVSEVDHLSPLGNSDHCVLKFGCELHAEQSSTTIKYKLDKGDYEKLNNFLDIDWDKLLDPSILTVDEMWEKFKLTVLDGMSKYVPKNGRQRKIRKNFQPFSAELCHLIHRKHHLWNLWMSSRQESGSM